MIKELEHRTPHMQIKGIYTWDDMVADKINEIIRSQNTKELTSTGNMQLKQALDLVREEFVRYGKYSTTGNESFGDILNLIEQRACV
jgi:dTDP-glucose pyrophosphorylase